MTHKSSHTFTLYFTPKHPFFLAFSRRGESTLSALTANHCIEGLTIALHLTAKLSRRGVFPLKRIGTLKKGEPLLPSLNCKIDYLIRIDLFFNTQDSVETQHLYSSQFEFVELAKAYCDL